ncbi:MAG: 3-isopropylmalate dehydratase small subunit [Caulobacterales bacterium]|uniref:3-isopropylmalate dehydratase small subunit n=1 Tax=Glycocaulis sp. TaxID=1969725 RepID=UPI003F9FED9C
MQPEPVTEIRSRSFALAERNIDTDQIIPARFLTTTERGALAEACFRDWRFDDAGNPTTHPLNSVDTHSHGVLLAGDNFGCGSSREHAPWALRDFGVRAVITTRAGDIFKANAANNGLVVAEIDAESHAALLEREGEEVIVSLADMSVTSGNIRAGFALEPFARTCLMAGHDALGFILAREDEIARFEASRAA